MLALLKTFTRTWKLAIRSAITRTLTIGLFHQLIQHQNVSFDDVTYANILHGSPAVPSSSHPDVLRDTTIKGRQREGERESRSWEIEVPGRAPWVFTGHLAEEENLGLLEQMHIAGPVKKISRKGKREEKAAQVAAEMAEAAAAEAVAEEPSEDGVEDVALGGTSRAKRPQAEVRTRTAGPSKKSKNRKTTTKPGKGKEPDVDAAERPDAAPEGGPEGLNDD